MVVKLGNLGPGETVILKTTVCSRLEIVGGHYAYCLPQAFFPDYKKHGAKKNAFNYEFNYQVCIRSNTSISNLVLPDNAYVKAKSEDNAQFII
jgi:hypothetical protein